MKLHEIKSSDIKVDENEARIEQFFAAHDVESGWTIRKDGKVDFNSSISVYDSDVLTDGRFPFTWGKIDGELSAWDLEIRSLKDWFPEDAHSVDLRDNKIENFEGLDGTQKLKYYNFTNNKLTDLHDIHKHITQAVNISLERNNITKNILGLLLINDLTMINRTVKFEFEEFKQRLKPAMKNGKQIIHNGEPTFIDEDTGEVFNPFTMALAIVGSHLKEGKAGVLKAQEELEDLNLDDFANL